MTTALGRSWSPAVFNIAPVAPDSTANIGEPWETNRLGCTAISNRPGGSLPCRLIGYLPRNLSQGLLERFGRLAALNQVLFVDDHRRHGADALRLPELLGLSHLGGKFLLWPRHGSPLHALSHSTVLQITLPRQSITAQLATLLRRRVSIIANHLWRDRDAVGQLAALQSVSEEISVWTLAHRAKVDAKLRHYLANVSYEKALHHVEATGEKLQDF